MRLLDYRRLGSLMPEARERYRDADPFPHIMIDDFLSPQVVSALEPHFRPGDRQARPGGSLCRY
jgi:hypothetical protein